MTRGLVVSLLCALCACASAEPMHEWYVLKTHDGVYAYDTGSVERDPDGVQSVSVLIASGDGYSEAGYFVSCRTNRGAFTGAVTTRNNKLEELLMVESGAKPFDLGWAPIPENGSMKVAADVACAHTLENAIRVDDRQAAIDKLTLLSN